MKYLVYNDALPVATGTKVYNLFTSDPTKERRATDDKKERERGREEEEVKEGFKNCNIKAIPIAKHTKNNNYYGFCTCTCMYIKYQVLTQIHKRI